MFRSILGFAIFAALAFVALNIFFGLLGGLFGLALWILKLAAIGFILYFVLRLVSPSTADKIREMIKGRPTEDRKSTRLNSSHGYISYAVFCLKKKKRTLRQRLLI